MKRTKQWLTILSALLLCISLAVPAQAAVWSGTYSTKYSSGSYTPSKSPSASSSISSSSVYKTYTPSSKSYSSSKQSFYRPSYSSTTVKSSSTSSKYVQNSSISGNTSTGSSSSAKISYNSSLSNYYGSSKLSTNKGTITVNNNTNSTINSNQDTSSSSGSNQSSEQELTIPSSAGLSAEEKELFDLINKERVAAGVATVSVNKEVTAQARLKAKEIAELNYSGHISPNYGSPADMLRNAGISFGRMGENLAKAGSVFKAHVLLRNSPEHNKIMLDSTYHEVGIGIASFPDKPGLVAVEIYI